MTRDPDQTRQRILQAAREILADEGFPGLGVNALAARAGVGKPLVYRYFGSLQGVAAALLAESPVPELADDARPLPALIGFGRGLAADRTCRDLLAWMLAAPEGPDDDTVPAVAPHGPDADRTLLALLSAGAAFLLIWRDHHDSWAGVPLKSATDMARLEMALARVIKARDLD